MRPCCSKELKTVTGVMDGYLLRFEPPVPSLERWMEELGAWRDNTRTSQMPRFESIVTAKGPQ